jgi:putative membrane protein
MIVRDHLPFRRIWPQVSKRLFLLFLFDATVSLLYATLGVTWISLPALPLAMMGATLSLFLAFRNNSAYDRWWEARTLWGSLVNNSRTLARQALTLVDREPAGSPEPPPSDLVELQIAYVHALRCHLRRQNPFPELRSLLSAGTVALLRRERNVPAAMLLMMGRLVRRWFDTGRLDSIRLTRLDQTIADLCNVQGACERIKNTPLPRQYEYFPRVMVGIYCLLLPLGLVSGLGLLTPVASTALSFLFISLETIGRDIEDPFENTVHDTPMSTLSRMIEINLRQNLDAESAPAEVRPIDGFAY